MNATRHETTASASLSRDPQTSRGSRRLRWAVWAGSWLIRLLGRTWRIRTVNRESTVEAMRRAGRPIIFSLWHGDMLPLLYQHRNEGITVLVSEHRDGELIAQTLLRFGFLTVRGSTTRGSGRALVGLTRTLSAGLDVAITPDGPRGPARSFAPGAVIAAQRARAPIIACGVNTPRAWRLRSWDGFRIPKPFSRVTIAYAGPAVPDAETARAAAEALGPWQALMLQAEQLAHA